MLLNMKCKNYICTHTHVHTHTHTTCTQWHATTGDVKSRADGPPGLSTRGGGNRSENILHFLYIKHDFFGPDQFLTDVIFLFFVCTLGLSRHVIEVKIVSSSVWCQQESSEYITLGFRTPLIRRLRATHPLPFLSIRHCRLLSTMQTFHFFHDAIIDQKYRLHFSFLSVE